VHKAAFSLECLLGHDPNGPDSPPLAWGRQPPRRGSTRKSLFAQLNGLGLFFVVCAVIGKLFALVVKLQSSGTISMDSAVGAQGKVYISIPAQGTGRVLVTVHNSLREYDAASVDQAAIATDTPIRVVWVGKVLIVSRHRGDERWLPRAGLRCSAGQLSAGAKGIRDRCTGAARFDGGKDLAVDCGVQGVLQDEHNGGHIA
jgi:hypothetical protein